MKLRELSSRITKNHVHVRGIMHLSRMHLPFSYKVSLDEDFDHDKRLKEIEQKGKTWEKRIGEFTGWRDQKHETINGTDVHITDCTLYPDDGGYWFLHCSVIIGGERHDFQFRYEDPKDAMSLDELKQIVGAKIAVEKAKKDKAQGHKGKLNAIARQIQEKAPRI